MGPDSSQPADEWFVTGTAAIGAAHVARGMPCQDAFRFVVPSASDEPVVGALSDGHGARRHFRSETGSALAVEVATHAALRHAERLGAMGDPAQVQAFAHTDLAAEIVQEWRQAVARDLENNPFSPEETMAMARGADSPEIPYGATLLLAVVAGRWLVCLQIGDGDLMVVAPDGRSAVPVPGDPTLDGLRTTSLCQIDALDSFREAVQDLETHPVLAVLLVSDGYSNAQSAEPWYPTVGADLARLLKHDGPEWVAERLPEWARLCASSEGSGDDTTMVLMVSRSAANSGGPIGSLPLSQARTVTESG
jgi:serine/threonine protein phosphatase PrpC